jgi:hypothetical protein
MIVHRSGVLQSNLARLSIASLSLTYWSVVTFLNCPNWSAVAPKLVRRDFINWPEASIVWSVRTFINCQWWSVTIGKLSIYVRDYWVLYFISENDVANVLNAYDSRSIYQNYGTVLHPSQRHSGSSWPLINTRPLLISRPPINTNTRPYLVGKWPLLGHNTNGPLWPSIRGPSWPAYGPSRPPPNIKATVLGRLMAPFRPQYKRPLAVTNMRPLLGQHQYKKPYASVGTQPLRGCHQLNGPFLVNTRPFVVDIRPLAAINTRPPRGHQHAAPSWPALI